MSKKWIRRADRLQSLPPYVFARLDELKAKARETGLDLIDLGMGWRWAVCLARSSLQSTFTLGVENIGPVGQVIDEAPCPHFNRGNF